VALWLYGLGVALVSQHSRASSGELNGCGFASVRRHGTTNRPGDGLPKLPKPASRPGTPSPVCIST